MKQITDFEGRTSDEVEVEYISTISGVIPVYSIKSYHSLTQFIGYGKYINNQWGNVYLRGQTSLYNGCLSPSLLRRKIISGENQLVKEKAEAATSNTVKFSNININHRFSEYKHQINESLNGTQHFTGWNKDIIEPLLQHYGIKTHWIDIVDNIWVALWFALHKTSSTIADGREYIHMFENDDDEYGYVLLIGCDAQDNNPYQAGVYKSTSTIMVDLRKAVPSFFLRPHAQHALMLRKRSSKYEDFMKSAVKAFESRYQVFENGGITLYTAESSREDLDREIFADIHLTKYPVREFNSILNDLTNVVGTYEKLNHRNHKKDDNHLNKHAMHLVRLYLMCLDILEKGDIITYRGRDLPLLMSIRRGDYQMEDGSYRPEFFEMVSDFEKRLDYAKRNTNLPEHPDMKRVEEFVVSVNRRSLDV